MTSTSVLGNARRSRCSSTSTATSTPPPRTSSPPSTPPAGQLPKNLPSPPTLQQGQPGRLTRSLIFAVHSDVLPLTTVDDYAENVIAQQMSQIPGVGQVIARRSAEAGGARAGRPGQDRGARHPARGRGRTSSPSATRQRAQGIDQRRRAQFRRLRQRPAAEGRALERRHRRLPERRAGAHPRHRRRGRRAGEQPGIAAGRTASDGILLLVYKQPGANVIDAVSRIKAALPQVLASVPASIKVDTGDRPHHDHQGLGARRRAHAAADHLPGGDGDLPVPAQRLGDRHPGRHRAAGAVRHLRAACTSLGYSSTTCRSWR